LRVAISAANYASPALLRAMWNVMLSLGIVLDASQRYPIANTPKLLDAALLKIRGIDMGRRCRKQRCGYNCGLQWRGSLSVAQRFQMSGR
jgi:hypothetical protein